MSEAAQQQITGSTPASPPGRAVVVRDVHVIYRIYGDGQRPTLRRLVARRFQPRPAREVHAVRGVNFTLQQGEALGLIGRNGSGKSTLLRAVAGLLPATSGEIYARQTPVLLGVGAALHPELSGRRNIFLGGTALGMPRAEIERRFDEIVEFSGLGEFIDMPLRAYSSGMQARLQFSIATAVTPDVLLIDEALAVGDEEFKRRSEARMRELLGQAGAILLVSHSMEAVADMCTRVLWLDRGEIVRDGEPGEVIAAYRHATRAG